MSSKKGSHLLSSDGNWGMEKVGECAYKAYRRMPNGKNQTKRIKARSWEEAKLGLLEWRGLVEAREARSKELEEPKETLTDKAVAIGNENIKTEWMAILNGPKEQKAEPTEPTKPPASVRRKQAKEEAMPPKKEAVKVTSDIYVVVFRGEPKYYVDDQDKALMVAEALNTALTVTGATTTDRWDVVPVARWAA